MDCNRCTDEGLAYSPDKCLDAQNTWAVRGSIKGTHVCLTATSADKRADEEMLLTTRQRRNKPLSISTTPTYMMQMGDIAYNSQRRLPQLFWELLVPLLRNAYFKTNDLSCVRDAGTPLLSVCSSMTTWDMLRKFHISTCRKTAPNSSTYQCMVCQSFSMLPPKHLAQ